MEIITLLIFISLIIAVGFLIVFLWNLKSGQYDDTYSPSVRMLFDDKPKAQKQDGKANAGGELADKAEGDLPAKKRIQEKSNL
jgi:cbb3-type cytochrome oxidase maturation protein